MRPPSTRTDALSLAGRIPRKMYAAASSRSRGSLAGNILDDPARLKAERAAADRAYNDALTNVDRALQRPVDLPHPPPDPDDHQVTALNTLWKITAPAPAGGWRRAFVAAVRRVVAPMFEQQQAFNAAVVDHINRNLPV